LILPGFSYMSLERIKSELKKYSSKEKAKLLQRFFKTGPGEYAEGDVFLGVMVPNTRKVALNWSDLSDEDNLKLLRSPFHEERLLALLIFIDKYNKGSDIVKKKIYGLYLANTRYINNWDLVDLSALYIVGAYLADKNRSPLYTLAGSKSLWERRIAILSTFYFIRYNQFTDALKIAELLMDDEEDLIHKAVGWMLREVGKRDIRQEEGFLNKHCHRMPRVMLRYAIERFPEAKRKMYLGGLKL
jgi:3-methyladenine DNA glycosylase AlkD